MNSDWSSVLKSGTTRAIFIWSGTTPWAIDIMWARGSEMIWMDSLIIDIGILSHPAAFPEAKDWAVVIILFSVVGLKKIDSRNDPDRKSLLEEGGGCVFFAKFGIVAKYLQNLFPSSNGSEIFWPSDLNIVFNWGLGFFLFKTLFKIFQVACVFDLASSNFFS